MKPQSPDTSLDAELVLIGMIRKAPMSSRFAFVQAWTASMLEAGSQYVRQLHPQASDEEARLLFIERQYGKDLADELRWSLHAYHMQVTAAADYQRAIRPLAKLCEELDIPYALSGSLASSLYGLRRATLHIDFVADLRRNHLPSFCVRLSGLYLLHPQHLSTPFPHQTRFTPPLLHS